MGNCSNGDSGPPAKRRVLPTMSHEEKRLKSRAQPLAPPGGATPRSSLVRVVPERPAKAAPKEASVSAAAGSPPGTARSSSHAQTPLSPPPRRQMRFDPSSRAAGAGTSTASASTGRRSPTTPSRSNASARSASTASPREPASPLKAKLAKSAVLRDNATNGASSGGESPPPLAKALSAVRQADISLRVNGKSAFSSDSREDDELSLASDSDEPEFDVLNTTQYTKVKGVGETYRPDNSKWEGRPLKAPANLPKDYEDWVPFRSYSNVPPLCHYTMRNGIFWVAVEDNAMGRSSKSITPVSVDEDLNSPTPPATPLLTTSQLAGSLKIRTVRSFSQLYANVTPERLQKEQQCLPAVPQQTPRLGYCYYYVRENLPVGTEEADIFKTGFGLWVRCTEDFADRNHEQWFAGRTKTTAEVLGLPHSNEALPKKIPKLHGFVWVPYKPGVVELPFLKDTTVTAGVFRGDDGTIWQSYYHTCVPEAEHAFGEVPQEPPLPASGKVDVQRVAAAAMKGNLSSGRPLLAAAGTSASDATGWGSASELPKPPRNLPKLNERLLRRYGAAACGGCYFWHPCLLESKIPKGTTTVAVRTRGGCTVYWAGLRQEVAEKVRFGTHYKAETRSWAQIFKVAQRDVPAELPPLRPPHDGWVLYRDPNDIAPEVLKQARSQLALVSNGDYWLSLPRSAADAIGEPLFVPEPNQRPHPSLQVIAVESITSESDVAKVLERHKRTLVLSAPATEASPFARAAVAGVRDVVKNVHRINCDSVWVPYHVSESVSERYTSFPQLGGHIFTRGSINWVVYRIENVPKGRKSFKGRTSAYSEMFGLKNVTYLPHCDPELMNSDSAWVPFPELEVIPPEVVVLRNFDHTDKHDKTGRLFHWRLLKKNFGEGFLPSRTSFMEALGITRAPYGLPRATRGDFWVPYPSVEQVTDGLEDCPRVLLQGVVWVLVEKVPAPEKGLPALRLPEIPKKLRDQWPYDAEVDAILRRHLSHTCLLKMVTRAKKQGLPKNQLLKLMHHVLSVKDEEKLKDIEDRILDETGHLSRMQPGQVRESWMTQVLKVAGSNPQAKEDDSIPQEAIEALTRFLQKNEAEGKKETLPEGVSPPNMQGIADDFVQLQRLLSRRHAMQLPVPTGRERVFSQADNSLPPPGEIVTRKVLRALLHRVTSMPDEGQRRIFLLYLITEAVFTAYYFRVNFSQQLALICMTSLDHTFGAGGGIGEMKTGEGKSVTIAMAAAYHALCGQKVDIMTSSEILARRDAGKTRAFFALLGLTVTHNCPCKGEGDEEEGETNAASPRKKRAVAYNPDEKVAAYKADVVYGTVPEFQFTFIRDVYLNHNERGERSYDIAIIDEVDNMLIDSSGRCSRLSSTIAGMDQVHWVYYLIHARLAEWSNPDLDVVHEQVLNHPLMQDMYPASLREMVLQNLKQWIHSCFKTRTFQANREYVVRKNEVVNVDNANTGVLQYGTVLSNGVHQFLQVKENVPVSDETATGGFSSVLAFFQLYKRKTGLTGTIGEDEEKREFRACYDLQFFHILPFHEAQRVEEVDVVPHADALKDTLVSIVQKEAVERRRPVLIIAESIGESNAYCDHIKASLEGVPEDVCSLQRYTGVQSKKEEHVLRDAGNPGIVTVSTNLAGRGMDIVTTSDSEERGGLFVVCCFLPVNMRVELQAAGRTARQGKRGTFHLLSVSTNPRVDQLKLRRKQQNQIRTQHKLDVTIPVAQHTAELFSDFCKQKDVHIEKVKHLLPFSAKYEKRALKERWIAFMQQYHSRYQSVRSVHDANAFIDEQDAKFRAFRDCLVRDLKNRTAVRNPLQYARRAAEFITQERYVLARQDLQRAATLPGGADHPTVQLLLGFVASKAVSVSGGTGRGYGPAAVARHLAAACEGYRKWLDFAVQSKRVFPRATRMLVVESSLVQVVASIAETLKGLDRWLQDSEGVPLKALLEFVPNEMRTHIEEKAPDTCGNNTVRLKRLGIVGKVVCRVHQAKLSTMRETLFETAGVEMGPPTPKSSGSEGME